MRHSVHPAYPAYPAYPAIPGRYWLAVATPLVLAGAFAGPAQAAVSTPASTAAACPGWAAMRPPNPGASTDDLFGVTVLSRRNVWAVGDYSSSSGAFRTLIEHWNGRSWQRVPSPDPGRGANYLSSVRAVSASNIWAVGDYASGSGGVASNKTLILHYNGSRWRQVSSPSPGGSFDDLNGVSAVSASSIWAVGLDSGSSDRDQSLVLHWNGRQWRQVASPSRGKFSTVLLGVAALSRTSAWAVGSYDNGHGSQSLALHWNGRRWSQASTPNPDGSSELESVAASSGKNAWAVGDEAKGRSVTLHWNGRRWTRVPSPDILRSGDDNILYSVAVTSTGNAWAVGQATIISTGTAFELHWNGRKWSNMASPTPGDTSAMYGVAAASASDAWTVGMFSLDSAGAEQRNLAFRCR
jgi:hypothetical protein